MIRCFLDIAGHLRPNAIKDKRKGFCSVYTVEFKVTCEMGLALQKSIEELFWILWIECKNLGEIREWEAVFLILTKELCQKVFIFWFRKSLVYKIFLLVFDTHIPLAFQYYTEVRNALRFVFIPRVNYDNLSVECDILFNRRLIFFLLYLSLFIKLHYIFFLI